MSMTSKLDADVLRMMAEAADSPQDNAADRTEAAKKAFAELDQYSGQYGFAFHDKGSLTRHLELPMEWNGTSSVELAYDPPTDKWFLRPRLDARSRLGNPSTVPVEYDPYLKIFRDKKADEKGQIRGFAYAVISILTGQRFGHLMQKL